VDYGLTGKRSLILASSRGLGKGIAEALAAEGSNVLLCGRSEDKLAAAAAGINANGQGTAQYTTIDLSDKDASSALFDVAMEKLGGVDILVNNTGGPPPGSIIAQDGSLWRAHFEMMVMRVVEITDLCLPGMRISSWGRIITVGSSGVVQALPNLGMSNALRSTLVGWSKSLSTEVAGDGITANMVIPGRIHTERVDELDAAASKRTGKSVDDVARASRATIPVGRYGKVEEFAAVAVFLASQGASYVTGSVIRCDGGAIRSV
jgi:3-oxoacyl-[acyl-carrier protein] reductase